jgi:hypothetical protein
MNSSLLGWVKECIQAECKAGIALSSELSGESTCSPTSKSLVGSAKKTLFENAGLEDELAAC